MTTLLSSNSVGASKLDRRVAVAPMMDWTDEVCFAFEVSDLRALKKACHLYGTSNSARQHLS
jgi:tRNA-dihydrouridine synthase